MREPLFTERLNLAAVPGTMQAVKAAAKEEGQTASEFIRQAIKAELRRVDQVGDAHAAGV